MNITLSIKLDEASLSAITKLIRTLGEVPSVEDTEITESSQAEKVTETTDKGPFLWANHKTGEFGKVSTKAAYDKLKAKDADVVRVTESQFKELSAEAKKREAEEKAAKKTMKKDKPRKADAGVPDKAELIEVFSEFLPKDLDKETRIERREFVTTILQRFGATKVSNLDDSHWALAIELVQRKLAGEDIDPSEADFDQFDEDSDEDDLV